MNIQPYKIAGDLGKILEEESVQDAGTALGIVLAQFILLVDQADHGIDEGIQSIADDAKESARRIRNMRQ